MFFQGAASNSEKSSSKGSNKDEIKPKIQIKCKDKVRVINEKANPEDEVIIFSICFNVIYYN